MTDKPYILWFQDCDKGRLPLIGGKNASLGEMTRAGIRVPPGFAVTTTAYREFMAQANIAAEISGLLANLDPDDTAAVEAASWTIRQIMGSSHVPADIEDAIHRSYHQLCTACGVADLPVAVRSSATAEDLPNASFAGQQDTSLWVRSEGIVLIRTIICWSSLFTPRAISYRNKMGFPHDKVLISVGVQKMANARTAGVMFTLNPANGDRSKIVIEGSWGLGESVVAGEVTPDNFLVDKVTFDILRRKISPKLMEYLPDQEYGRVIAHDVPAERQASLCLSDEEVIALAKLGKSIERYYGAPQDIEWAVDHDLPFPENIVILQSRPETVWSQHNPKPIANPESSVLDHIVANLIAGKRIRDD